MKLQKSIGEIFLELIPLIILLKNFSKRKRIRVIIIHQLLTKEEYIKKEIKFIMKNNG
jgi:hypothetical protein